MIKGIVFDFGNVICTFDNARSLRRLANGTARSTEELNNLIYSSGLQILYESGKISSEEFFDTVKGKSNLSISQAEFIRAYTDIFTPLPATFELIGRLKRCYVLGLLSNTSEWDFEFAIKPTSVFPLFDAASLSFQVGHMKPAPEIYRDILHKLRLKPSECIYIDDIEGFARAAREIGMVGITYRSHEQLVGELRQLNLAF